MHRGRNRVGRSRAGASAGIGLLAMFAELVGDAPVVNEFAETRADLLDSLSADHGHAL
jgi:hypothetical protein